MTSSAVRPYGRHLLLLSGGLLAVVAMLVPVSAQTTKLFIIQTNAAGDNVHLIDPTTDKVVAEIQDEEAAHGVAVAPDGSKMYLTNEALATLDVIDMRTMKLAKRIPLTGGPNNVAIHKNGKKVYAAIQGAEGGIDIIDTEKMEKSKFIRILRGVHNAIITPDSKYIVGGSTGGNVATVIDTETELPVWSIHFEGGVRVFCFETNPDGSTKRLYSQVTNLHGFAIVDWATRKEVGRIKLPDIPVAERNSEGLQGAPAHGILVSPDKKTLWSTSKINSAVYAYSLPDVTYLGEVKVGKVPDWLTFTPDSKKLYVANAHDNTVSVVDVAARKEITRIKVGQVPKRNTTAMLIWPPAGTQ